MENDRQKESFISGYGVPARPGLLKRLAGLALAIFLVLFFMLYLGPAIQETQYFRPMVRFIEERGIDASALYYTEIEEFSDADISMNNTMDYMPQKDSRSYKE